jgi:hypothetical protein
LVCSDTAERELIRADAAECKLLRAHPAVGDANRAAIGDGAAAETGTGGDTTVDVVLATRPSAKVWGEFFALLRSRGPGCLSEPAVCLQ